MVLPVPPRKSAGLPIIGWLVAVILICAATVTLVTIIKTSAKRQELRTLDAKRLYTHCKLVQIALAEDAQDLLYPDKKFIASVRFGEAPLHSVREIELCVRHPVDLAPREQCLKFQDYGCLVMLARQALQAVSETARSEP